MTARARFDLSYDKSSTLMIWEPQGEQNYIRLASKDDSALLRRLELAQCR